VDRDPAGTGEPAYPDGQAGDKITTTVRETKAGVWSMQVMDKTTKLKAGRVVKYAGSNHASVETIHERPCIADGCSSVEDFAELTQTTNVTFDPGKYATALGIAPKTPLLTLTPNGALFQIFMLANDQKTIIASPSLADIDNDGFTVADGSVSPPPPKS
jgi:hypothetical protein